MFALSPLVSHLIPDSRLPPFHARLSGAEPDSELVSSQRRERVENNGSSVSEAAQAWEGGFEVVWLSHCLQGILICSDCLMFLQVGEREPGRDL